MPKRISKGKRPSDVNQLAHFLVNASTQKGNESPEFPTREQVSVLMAAMGRKGGKIGGKRRLKTMTSEERSRIAKKAARTRWKKAKKRKSKDLTATK